MDDRNGFSLPEYLKKAWSDQFSKDFTHTMRYDGKSASSEKPCPSHNRAKRILYVDHTAKIGGGEIAILNLINAIDKTRFYPVVVLASSGPFIQRLQLAGVETYVLELDPSVSDTRKDSLGIGSILKAREAFICIAYTQKLSKFMRELDVDLVHTNSLKAHIIGGIAARIAGLPVLWHVRDAIDSNYLPGVIAKTVKLLARSVPNYIVTNSRSTLKKLGLKSTKHLSINEKEQMISSVRVVHDGCDPANFNEGVNASRSQRDSKAPIVTMIGRIAEWKGQHVVLRAAAIVLKHYPDVIFRIVGAPLFGEQQYEMSLYALAKELKIEQNVEFLGFREDIPSIIAGSDILVHASIIGEPFGQVVIEGMFSGKPVIATNGGALPEIVDNGVTGYLVEMGSDLEMAKAIQELLANPNNARAMGLAGRQQVLSNFTIDRCASDFHEVYDLMLQGTVDETARR